MLEASGYAGTSLKKLIAENNTFYFICSMASKRKHYFLNGKAVHPAFYTSASGILRLDLLFLSLL